MTKVYKRSLMILADGSRPDVFKDELDKGNLPHISKHLLEKGCFKTIVTAFPSTTGPAYLPYLSGYHPGTFDIPGIRWFHKDMYAKKGWGFKSFRSYVGLETLLLRKDLKPGLQTAFDIFQKPLSILNNIYRDLPSKFNKTKHSRIWYLYYAHITDHWSFVDDAMTKKLLHSLEDDFDFAFMVYPSIDEYAHRSSPFYKRTIEAYHDLDRNIGKIVKALQEKGMYDDTLISIVSDHGLSETHTHFDISPFLEEEKGMKTFFYTQIFKRNFEAASMVSGNGMCNLYFKGEKGWKGRMSYEELSTRNLLLDELRSREEIALLAAQGQDGSIHLLTEKGHGAYKVEKQQIQYSWSHEEPLGIFDSSLKSKSFSLDESLDLSFDSYTPDVFYQLYKLFQSPRAGDLIVSAKTGYDLRDRYEHPEHKASHGALCPEHMKVPFIINHPLSGLGDLRQNWRSMDVYPSVLDLMGQSYDKEELDGRSLV